jgi:hypothetical protein
MDGSRYSGSESYQSDSSDIDNDVIDDIPTSLESNLAELASGLAELERECEELLSTNLCPEDEALLLASLSMVRKPYCCRDSMRSADSVKVIV